jgi:hypothetical protein
LNHYTERERDIPNPVLRRWKAVKERQGGLSLEEYGEMAGLPDTALNYDPLIDAARWKYDLTEWRIVRTGRNLLRFFGSLSPDMRRQAQADDGVSLARLIPEGAELLRRLMPGDPTGPLTPEHLRLARFHIRRLGPGTFTWVHRGMPVLPAPVEAEGKVREEVEAKVVELLKNRGESETTFQMEKRAITGPMERILFRLQVGEWRSNVPGPDEMFQLGEIGMQGASMCGRGLPPPDETTPRRESLPAIDRDVATGSEGYRDVTLQDTSP